MTRRLVCGVMGDGSIDIRMSRPGYDALTADINDRQAISFSAQRQMGVVAAAGEATSLNSWAPFSAAFPDITPVLTATLRAGGDGGLGTTMNERIAVFSGSSQMQGTPYVGVVQAGQILFVQTVLFDYPIYGGEHFVYYGVA